MSAADTPEVEMAADEAPEEEIEDPKAEADGYYGEEELEDGELDLSFLDEDEQDEAAGKAKK
jgi:hypothetical protein